MIKSPNSNKRSAALFSLSTVVPDYVFSQDDATDIATRMFGDRIKSFEKLLPVFANTGIEKRYSVCPPSWFEEDHDWPERSEAFIAGATDLFKKAASVALSDAGLKAKDVDTIVTISSTGIATPTIEARVLSEMGFRKTVRRVPVFGLGCAGGITGLGLAGRLAVADPGSVVLLVVIELCTLAFRNDEMTKSNLIATALFGDGAAAAVIATEKPGALAEIEFTYEHTWPDTLNIMGWNIDPTGFGVVFDKSIPRLVETQIADVFEDFLSHHSLNKQDIDQYIFHPGGTKVIDALEATFKLGQGALTIEREVLRDYGNMSAPTVLFVLKRTMASGLAGRSFLSTLGPGFTASFATLQA